MSLAYSHTQYVFCILWWENTVFFVLWAENNLKKLCCVFTDYDEVVTLGRPGREMFPAWLREKTEQRDWERRMGRSVWGFWQGVFSTAVLYGSLALFTSILHNVFLLYYVETFVSVYKIDKVSFWVGEVSEKKPESFSFDLNFDL